MEQFCSGKGFNQAIALRRAGNEVYFADAVGQDSGMLLGFGKRVKLTYPDNAVEGFKAYLDKVRAMYE